MHAMLPVIFLPQKINTKKNDGTQRAPALHAKIYAGTFGMSCIYSTRPSGEAGSTGASPKSPIRDPGPRFNPEIPGLHLTEHPATLRNFIDDPPSMEAETLVQKAAWDIHKEPEIVF